MPFKIAFIYAGFSIFWIIGSDTIINMLFPDQTDLITTYKGWSFVILTAVLIYTFLHKELRHRSQVQSKMNNYQDSLNKLTQAVGQSPVSILISSLDGDIEYVNQAFERLSGYSVSEAQGKKPSLFHSGKTPSRVYDELWRNIKSGTPWEGELLNQNKSGAPYWVYARISPLVNAEGKISHFLAIEEDITQRKTQEHEVTQHANYDNLTDLPNRFLALDRMSYAITNAIRHDSSVVLMFIDLDNFKQINDTLGHDKGDRVLIKVADRIKQAVRQADTVARYGGDEFLVVLGDLSDHGDATHVADKIISALIPPVTIDNQELSITASIGMAVFPEDGQDPYELLRSADAAMFGAKDKGGNGYQYHSDAIHSAATSRIDMEQKLQHALQNNELSLCYHPLIEMESGKMTGVEVLLRWDNPELGRIEPDTFIPLAETTGVIIPIGEWVIQNACQQLRCWLNEGMQPLRLSINLTPRQFCDPGLSQVIGKALEFSRLNADNLELEITEALLLRDQDNIRKILEKLRRQGVRIALDDFGTGYSSLNYLKNFPFDSLKIDRCFVRDLLTQPADMALVSATVAMAQGLGLRTVGEGVETEEQLTYLKHQGIHSVQGYYFTKPLPADEFREYCITADRSNHS